MRKYLGGTKCHVFVNEESSLIVKLAFAAFLSTAFIGQCNADCQIADAGLEEAVLQNPRLRGPVIANASSQTSAN